MDDLITDEQRALRRRSRSSPTRSSPRRAYEYDTKHALPMDIIAQMGDMGLFALPFPEEYGGRARDYIASASPSRQIGRVDQTIGVTLEAGVGLGAMPIYRYGTDQQKAEYLPDLVAGRALAGFGLTEADAGSDAGATRTTAVLDGDEWVINGSSSSSPTRAPQITRFSRHRGDGRGVRADGRYQELRRSSCRTAPRGSRWRRATTRSAGTPPTRTR